MFLISAVWQHAHIDLLQPSDQFPTRMRKMWVSMMFLLSALPLYLAVTSPVSTAVPYACAVVVVIGQWVYVRINRDLPLWLIMLNSNSMSLTQIAITMFSPLDNFLIPYIAYVMRIVMSDFSRQATLANLIIPVTGLLITEYNHAYADTRGPSRSPTRPVRPRPAPSRPVPWSTMYKAPTALFFEQHPATHTLGIAPPRNLNSTQPYQPEGCACTSGRFRWGNRVAGIYAAFYLV